LEPILKLRRICLAWFVALLFAAPAAAGAPGGPPPLSGEAAGAVVPATLGSYCWSNRSSVGCADAAYPLPIRRRLAVSPGGRLWLRIGAPAAAVEVSLHHVEGDHQELLSKLSRKPASPARRRWEVKLPSDLELGNAVDISVEYADGRGDADFWLGLRPAAAAAEQ
jgi:hypothetical protein